MSLPHQEGQFYWLPLNIDPEVILRDRKMFMLSEPFTLHSGVRMFDVLPPTFKFVNCHVDAHRQEASKQFGVISITDFEQPLASIDMHQDFFDTAPEKLDFVTTRISEYFCDQEQSRVICPVVLSFKAEIGFSNRDHAIMYKLKGIQ